MVSLLRKITGFLNLDEIPEATWTRLEEQIKAQSTDELRELAGKVATGKLGPGASDKLIEAYSTSSEFLEKDAAEFQAMGIKEDIFENTVATVSAASKITESTLTIEQLSTLPHGLYQTLLT